jgi:hypothetical protein
MILFYRIKSLSLLLLVKWSRLKIQLYTLVCNLISFAGTNKGKSEYVINSRFITFDLNDNRIKVCDKNNKV